MVKVFSSHVQKNSSASLPSLSVALPAICGPGKVEAEMFAEGNRLLEMTTNNPEAILAN